MPTRTMTCSVCHITRHDARVDARYCSDRCRARARREWLAEWRTLTLRQTAAVLAGDAEALDEIRLAALALDARASRP